MYIHGAFKTKAGRLMTTKDRSLLLEIVIEACKALDWDFQGQVGFEYEFYQRQFANSGPVE